MIVEYGATWMAKGIADLLRMYGPLWVAGKVPSGHAFVISGIEGNSDADAALTVYDPWPPGKGTVYPKTLLSEIYKKFPEATDYILHKSSAGQEVYIRPLPWVR